MRCMLRQDQNISNLVPMDMDLEDGQQGRSCEITEDPTVQLTGT